MFYKSYLYDISKNKSGACFLCPLFNNSAKINVTLLSLLIMNIWINTSYIIHFFLREILNIIFKKVFISEFL
jgi:hypothetical protein